MGQWFEKGLTGAGANVNAYGVTARCSIYGMSDDEEPFVVEHETLLIGDEWYEVENATHVVAEGQEYIFLTFFLHLSGEQPV